MLFNISVIGGGNHSYALSYNKTIYLRGNPEILVDVFGDSITYAGIFLGIRANTFRDSLFNARRFNTNEQRDKCYIEILDSIKQACEHYKTLL